MPLTLRKYAPLLAAIACQILFGCSMFFVKMGMAVVDQDTVKFLSFRFVTGFLTMSLILLFRLQKVRYRGKPWRLLLLCGLLNPLVSQVLETSSTSYAPTSQIAILSSLLPIASIGAAALINREYPTRRQLAFSLVSMSGVLLTCLGGGPGGGGTLLGVILVCSMVAVVSVQRVFVRRASRYFTSFESVYVTTAMGAAGFSLAAAFLSARQDRLSTFFLCLEEPRFILAFLYVGIGSCVAGFLLMTYANANLPAAVFASTNTLSTVVSILVGVFLLKEPFRPVDLAGVVIILVGILGVSLSYDAGKDHRAGAADAQKKGV